MTALGIIPSFASQPTDVDVLGDALASIRRTEPDLEVLVIDDHSPLPELREETERVTSQLGYAFSQQPSNEGFSRTVNVGLRQARDGGRDAVLINADIEFFKAGWLRKMEAQQRRDEAVPAEVVGGLLLYPNGLIQHAGIFYSLLHRVFDHRYKYAPGDLPEAQEAARCPVTGALQFIRHSALEEIGLYDENFRMGWEDVDYSLRVFMAGGDCVYQPKVCAFHFESLFRGRPSPKVADWTERSWLYFLKKHSNTPLGEWIPSLI